MDPVVTKQWLALRLPFLPLEVFGFSPDDTGPVIVTDRQEVVCTNRAASEAGIHIHMPASTAQLLVECQQLERDIRLEKTALHQLADCLYAYTPYIEKHPPRPRGDAGLCVEVSRSLKLFRGLPRMLTQIRQDLTASGYHYCLGLGHTRFSAWLLSLQSHSADTTANSPDNSIPRESTITRENTIAALASQPLAHLALCPQKNLADKKMGAFIDALEKSGFDTLGDLIRQVQQQSLASFRKRWGQEFATFLESVFDMDGLLQQPGLFASPLPLYTPEEFFYHSLQFDYPVTNTEQLQQPMEILLQALSDYLVSRQLQCQTIRWQLFDIHHNRYCLDVFSSQPQSRWQLLYELTRIQLENQPLPFEVDTLELICRQTDPLQSASQALAFNGHNRSRQEQDFAVTTARLSARLGEQALFKIAYNDSHIPELSNRRVSINSAPDNTLPAAQQQAVRPSWLFESPLPVVEKNQGLFWRGKLELLQGPERIEGQWWDNASARDYFVARRDDNLRVWLYYDLLKKNWFIQGVFA